MRSTPFPDIGAQSFMRHWWQRKPLLARGAIAGAADIVSPRELMALARREDVESRLVMREGRRWSVRNGPFRARELSRLPAGGWSLLVQGVDGQVPAARALMRRFGFVPYARHDDVMVSLAPPGGGVGPHFDSYDVFLVQGRGRRLWRYGVQRDLALVRGAPLRILARFAPKSETQVGPGDVLYLPPGIAHEGVAIDECMTLSVGFRAPSSAELGARFLEWAGEHLRLCGLWADPDLRPQRCAAQLPQSMLDQATRILDGARWTRGHVARFLGEFLTEPRRLVWFEPPHPLLALAAFRARVLARGVALHLQSRALLQGRHAYINGERFELPPGARRPIECLAEHGMLAPGERIEAGTIRLLHGWYAAGWLEIS